jgi:hypothetical protein
LYRGKVWFSFLNNVFVETILSGRKIQTRKLHARPRKVGSRQTCKYDFFGKALLDWKEAVALPEELDAEALFSKYFSFSLIY